MQIYADLKSPMYICVDLQIYTNLHAVCTLSAHCLHAIYRNLHVSLMFTPAKHSVDAAKLLAGRRTATKYLL